MKRVMSLVAILLVIGLLTSYSIEASLDAIGGSVQLFPGGVVKQVIITCIGILCFLVARRVPYEFWLSIFPGVIYIWIASLVAVLLPYVGLHISGSARWLNTGSFPIQPSQAGMVVVPLLATRVFGGKYSRSRAFKYYWRFLIFCLIPTVLVAIEPDLGTAGVILFSAILCLVGVGAPYLPLIGISSVIGAIGVLGIYLKSSWRIRILSFLDPVTYRKDSAYQLINSLTAYARGGVLGRGFMRSVQKFIHFPAQQNDFIFCIFAEEWGLIGAIIVVIMYYVLVERLISLSSHSLTPGKRTYLMALGVYIGVQAFVNIAVTAGLLPTTGVPLPFFSQGGNHVVFEMLALGIAANMVQSDESK